MVIKKGFLQKMELKVMNWTGCMHRRELFPCSGHGSLNFLPYELKDMMLLPLVLRKVTGETWKSLASSVHENGVY